jgi:hypothetical protein
MGSRRYDYVTMEDEFVRGAMSVRELARQHEIPSERVSSVHDQARRKDSRGKSWYDKRADFRNQSSDVTMGLLAKREASRRLRRVEVADHAIEVIDKYIGALERDLTATRTVEHDEGTVEEPVMRANVKDLVLLLDRLAPLFGQPTTVTLTEGRSFNVSGPPELGDGILAGLAGLVARPVGPGLLEPVSAGRSPLPGAPGPRQDQ